MKLPRFYPILDTATLTQRGTALLAASRAFLDAGAGILQIRHKGHWSRDLFTEAEEAARLCREHKALLIVNDRVDLAMLLDAGVHLGQDDLAPSEARRLLGPDRVIGVSTHNAEQLTAAAAEPVDYLAIGPIFPTISKESPSPVIGPEQIPSLRALARRPLVAIGGITRQNAQAVLNHGADSVAIISDLYPDPLTEPTLQARAAEWQTLCRIPSRHAASER